LHWFIGNIPSTSDGISKGETIIPYLQPLPYYGTGYHRIAFVLFRHQQKIDFSSFKVNSSDLKARIFRMLSFYKNFEDKITPSAIRFCQTKWDESCDGAMKSIGISIPRYFYMWNEKIKPEQKEFSMKSVPFDLYMDMYRNPATVKKEIQRKRLELLIDSQSDVLSPQKYPDLFYDEHVKNMPKFAHRDKIQQNIGKGIWSAIYSDYKNPVEQHEIPTKPNVN